MDRCKLKLLTSDESGFISIREGQDLIYLCFKNLLLNFNVNEFCAFRRMTKSVLMEDCLISFPDGSRRIILRSPYEGINFSFSQEEIRQLVDALDEAYYMRKIYTFISDN